MIFLTSLIFIILIHETGHLIAAKICNCKVPVFSIGFGKPLYKKKIGETIYQVCPILFGGYCELYGELKHLKSSHAFTNKTYSEKVFISLAGIIMNLITGGIAYTIGYHIQNIWVFGFGYYSIWIGLTNALPIPALDGSYPWFFLLEKKLGKKKTYLLMQKIFSAFFKWLMIINYLCIPLFIYWIWKGKIL